VSHANNKTRRRFLPNIQRKRYFLPDENRWITLSVSAHGMKIIGTSTSSCMIRCRQSG